VERDSLVNSGRFGAAARQVRGLTTPRVSPKHGRIEETLGAMFADLPGMSGAHCVTCPICESKDVRSNVRPERLICRCLNCGAVWEVAAEREPSVR